ncbi:MAG TPA: NAD(P)H-binding protein [Acidimicrobiia bacterium]|nr:NAD(P)H-binding protein [Acidimicrobiia bacterium]
MPVIVIGADTHLGRQIVAALVEPDREVRAFVTDIAAAEELRAAGVKVALGDVSDSSHVTGACTRCFSAVFVAEAASDHRERSFAATPESVIDGWVEAVRDAGVRRVIWVGEEFRSVPGAECAAVSLSDADIPSRVVALDDAASL